MKRFLLILFILVVLAQWFVPASMIWKRESVLKNGRAFRFQTEPVDPEDPLRGKYVQLSFKADTAYTLNNDLERGDHAFAELEVNAAGYAQIRQLHKVPPPSNDYVEVSVYYWVSDEEGERDSTRVLVEFPFDQFFLDEYKAPKAESIYNEANIDSGQKTYALVNVYKGKGVIRDLFINDKSIYSYFK